MAIHQQVCLDDEAEQALQAIMLIAKLNMSEVLKQGLVLLQEQLKFNVRQSPTVKPSAIYKKLDLGKGGYAIVPSSQAKKGIKLALQRKLQR